MKYVFSILIIWINLQVVAQNTIKFTGVILDSTNTPVELSNVIAVDKETNNITSFGITDYQGRFVLKLENGKLYILKASFIGFETFEETILAEENINNPFKVELKLSSIQLEALEIVNEFPVVISGDTISYRADAFVKGNERKLEDVLSTLPGFEVDKNGDVKVQGKKVEKILVEGKEFFEGDTKIAVQNIPANAVERVQVLRNLNEVSPMKGINSEERLALNIQLTEDMKNMLFGDVEGGAGLENRYLTHTNLFFYNRKATINFIGDGNNIGEQAFSAMDYFRFGGGMRGLGGRSGSSFNMTEDNLGIMGLQNNTALNIDTKLGALNFDYVPGNSWRFSGFAIGSGSTNRIRTLSNRTYVNNENENSEILNANEKQHNLSGLTKIDISYTPNEKVHLGYEAFVKGSWLKTKENRLSDNLGFANSIQTISDQQPFSIVQEVKSFFAPNEKNVFSFEANYNHQETDPFIQMDASNQLFTGVLPLLDTNQFKFFQNKDIITNSQEAVGNWYRILNKTNHINLSIGNSYSKQFMTSSIRQSNNPELEESRFQNDVEFTFSDLYGGINFKTKLGDLILNPGLNFHHYLVKDKQLGTIGKLNKSMVLPELIAKYEIQRSQSVTLQYALQAGFTDVQKVASGILFQNYNNLYKGNRSLINYRFHNINLSYNNFSMYNHINIFGGLNYQKKYDDIGNSINYNSLERIISPVNILNPNDMLMAFGSVTKTFESYKIGGKANLSYFSTGNLINEIENRNNSFTQRYELFTETTLFELLIVKAGYEKMFNKYNSNTTSNTFSNDMPYGEAEITVSKYFNLSAEYQFNNYRSKNGQLGSKYDFLNAAIYFQKDKSPWQLKLSGLNIMNTISIRRDSFSESLISTYKYYVQPRYFILTLKYDL